MSYVSQPGRIYRLCQKELRESLRDRRTIITLVLMPLLVYPLLSMILQRLLLTANPQEQAQVLRIGLEDEALLAPLEMTIAFGKQTLAIQKREILSVEHPDAPPSILTGENSSAQTALRHLLGQDVQMFYIERDGRQALLSGAIDVLVRDKGAGKADASAASGLGVDDPSQRDADFGQLLEQMPEDRYAIDYVPNDRHSELAVQFLRSVFAAVNDEVARQLMDRAGGVYHPRVTMSAAPIKMASSASATLASLVPLVLVLMTIAGAVYPAIDLTAGERERGTLEAMIVSPTPRPLLLFAKYVAVVTVALLTAVANLLAMSITLWASGLGRMVFGDVGLPLVTIVQILSLLVLFAMFFSAVLLSITSFAKSFKEAQAYLIPVMLVSLAPGVLSLLPQVRLTNVLAAVPLANIVLLSRDVLIGGATREAVLIAIVCTAVYALAAVAVASRLFGSDASLQGSQGSWRDFVRRPDHRLQAPTLDQMALTMACLFPLYFIASTSLPMLGGSLTFKLLVASLISWVLIFGLPTLVGYYRRLDFKSTFLLRAGPPRSWPLWALAMMLFAGSLWMVSHQLMVISRDLGFATFSPAQMKQAEAIAEKMPQIPLAILLFTGALTPALCEEWFFRGFVLSSLRRFGFATAVVGSAFLFGLMHVLTSNMLSLERLLPSLFMGLVLGWIAWQSRSLWPGVLLHAMHNGLMLSVIHFKTQLQELGIGLQEGSYLPLAWLAGGALAILLGALVFWSSRPRLSQTLSNVAE